MPALQGRAVSPFSGQEPDSQERIVTQRRRSSDATSDRFTSSLAAILAVLVALSAACGNSGRTPAGKRQFDAVAPQAVRVGGAGAGVRRRRDRLLHLRQDWHALAGCAGFRAPG